MASPGSEQLVSILRCSGSSDGPGVTGVIQAFLRKRTFPVQNPSAAGRAPRGDDTKNAALLTNFGAGR